MVGTQDGEMCFQYHRKGRQNQSCVKKRRYPTHDPCEDDLTRLESHFSHTVHGCRFTIEPFAQHRCRTTPPPQDISFGGYFIDKSGKAIVGDDGLNGVELGPAVEVTPGWKPADRLAAYTGGSGTNTLSFIYVVQEVSL